MFIFLPPPQDFQAQILPFSLIMLRFKWFLNRQNIKASLEVYSTQGKFSLCVHNMYNMELAISFNYHHIINFYACSWTRTAVCSWQYKTLFFNSKLFCRRYKRPLYKEDNNRRIIKISFCPRDKHGF